LQGGALLLPGLAYALSVISTTALVEPLFAHTSSFTLTLFTTFMLVGWGMVTLLLPLTGFLAVRLRTRTTRSLFLVAIFGLGALIARFSGMRVNWNIALLSWNWPLTFGLAALTVGLVSLNCWQQVSHEYTPSDRWKKLGHSILTLAGDVVLFELLLVVSNVVLFSVCALTCKVL
jgi:hypothetical protein